MIPLLKKQNIWETHSIKMMVAKSKSKEKKKKQKKTKQKESSVVLQQESKSNDVEKDLKAISKVSEYNIRRHCSQLIWCEVSKQNKRYLNFLELYDNTSKDIQFDDLRANSLLKYVEESFFDKYKNIQHDVNAFCVLLWTSNYPPFLYKKQIPKCIAKEDQIYKFIQKSIINDDGDGLILSMKLIRGINNVITNYPTSKQVIGYRGSKMSGKEFQQFKVNQTKRVGMYVACSMNKQIAEHFIGRGNVLITILIPKGCLNARIVPSPMSVYPDEVEILIPPYSLFKCVGKKRSVRNYLDTRELVLLLTKDNLSGKFDGLKNVPYWTA
eukprot:535045_1